ncbi:sulfite exporter TauE/SafE family protein [Candidatus Hecatella orcuttiae]|uniref:sulfite exporter TauE/SafE family protein n=1 Tax=Candidatus Hecatella orcuttiae TaxID=1935119 RepID=UPI002867FD94|nr:sulfite exporter TauE/SafE family protein [Candidatus Hecatella orcuttiae]
MEAAALIFTVGVLIGTLGSMLGLGGGFLFVPYLHFLLGQSIHSAVGTSMASNLFTTSSATLSYFHQKRVDYKLGLLLESAAAPGSFLGASLTGFLEPTVLRTVFGVLAAYAGVSMLTGFSLWRKRIFPARLSPKPLLWRRLFVDGENKKFEFTVNVVPLLAGGFAVGLLSGIAGIGGGLLKVPLMTLGLGVPVHVAIATSSLTSLITSAFGAAAHSTLGHVNLPLTLALGLGAFGGAQVGVRISKKAGAPVLRRIFGLVLLLIAFRMLWVG